jgi:general secretion pathway protein L
LVTAAPKDKVAEHLRFLAQADVEPSAINVDAMALFSVTQFLRNEHSGVPNDLAIIDVGASKTTLCLIHEGRPVVLRTILWGGNQLTHALAIRDACSFADAERRKRTMGVEQVDTWLEPLLRELRVTIQAYEGVERGRFTHCWVSGGGAKLREVGGFMARQLGLYPVGPKQGFGPDSPRAFSIAFGLAIHPKIVKPRWRFTPSPLGLALDLKTAGSESAATATVSKYDRRLMISAAVVIGLLALGDFFIHLMLKDQRVAELKAALQTQYEQVFKASALPGDELDQARHRMGQVDKALAVLDGSQGKVLSVLSAFVKQLPVGTSVKVRELTVDGRTILMEAETTSFDAVEKIKHTFSASSQFDETSVTETRVGAVPNQVVFRMTVTVRP